jgi:predicted component of type VI protein secretion system
MKSLTRSAKKTVRRAKPPQRIPLQTPGEVLQKLNRTVDVVQGLLNDFKRLRVGSSEAVAAKIEIDSSKMQEQIAVAVKETLGKRMQLGERSLEVLEEMQRILLESRNPTQKESLNESSIAREYIR